MLNERLMRLEAESNAWKPPLLRKGLLTQAREAVTWERERTRLENEYTSLMDECQRCETDYQALEALLSRL